MPYQKGNLWVGQIRNNGRRKQKIFKSKERAIEWEVRTKLQAKAGKDNFLPKATNDYMKNYSPLNRVEILGLDDVITIDEFKLRYRKLYEDPRNTVADIFDFMMEEVGLPVRYKDILFIAQKYKRGAGGINPKLRMTILKKDNHTCQTCGRKAPEVILEVDHIISKARGGITEERNLWTLCRECNVGKSDTYFNNIK